MSDILDRLNARDVLMNADILGEARNEIRGLRAYASRAADEIERLREALRLARADMKLAIYEIDKELGAVGTEQEDEFLDYLNAGGNPLVSRPPITFPSGEKDKPSIGARRIYPKPPSVADRLREIAARRS